MFSKIGIIAAMDKEFDGIKEKLSDGKTEVISGIEFISGKVGDKEIIAAKSGVGKVFAAVCAQTAIMRYKPDCIINMGIGGGIREDLTLLDVIVADKVVQHDMDTSPVGDPVGLISGINVIYIDADKAIAENLKKASEACGKKAKSGVIGTGDTFISREEERRRTKELFGTAACDMESGAVGHVCYINKVPFGIIRVISDNGNSSSTMDYGSFAVEASKLSNEIFFEFLSMI